MSVKSIPLKKVQTFWGCNKGRQAIVTCTEIPMVVLVVKITDQSGATSKHNVVIKPNLNQAVDEANRWLEGKES